MSAAFTGYSEMSHALLVDEALRLRARVAELEAAQKWKPLYDEEKDEWIAPADVDVLLFESPTHHTIVPNMKVDFARSTKGGWTSGWASHWMPLPPPPKETAP